MIDKLYKRIVRFFVETHIARIDFSSEEEAEEFYNWLYPDKSQKRELSMKKIIRICAWTMSVFAVVCLALMLICNQMVVNNAEGKVFSDIDSIKYNKVGLLLGTTPQARIGRITNYFFIYRIDAAEQLYKAGKIEKIAHIIDLTLSSIEATSSVLFSSIVAPASLRRMAMSEPDTAPPSFCDIVPEENMSPVDDVPSFSVA